MPTPSDLNPLYTERPRWRDWTQAIQDKNIHALEYWRKHYAEDIPSSSNLSFLYEATCYFGFLEGMIWFENHSFEILKKLQRNNGSELQSIFRLVSEYGHFDILERLLVDHPILLTRLPYEPWAIMVAMKDPHHPDTVAFLFNRLNQHTPHFFQASYAKILENVIEKEPATHLHWFEFFKQHGISIAEYGGLALKKTILHNQTHTIQDNIPAFHYLLKEGVDPQCTIAALQKKILDFPNSMDEYEPILRSLEKISLLQGTPSLPTHHKQRL